MNKLKTIRKQNKINGATLAEILGVSRVYYWQLETNKRRLSYENAFKLAFYFGMKPDELFYTDHIKENMRYKNTKKRY